MPERFVVADTSGRKEHHPEALERISHLPVDITLSACVSEEDFVSACENADVILLTACKITESTLERLPRLKGVVRYGTGLDLIDAEACRRRGVKVRNVRGFCTYELADHALALCLSLARQITLSAERVRRGAWSFAPARPPFSLHGKTAGIAGTGDAGRATAARLKSFGARILGFDPFYKGDETIQMSPMDILLEESDVVFLHCPLNEDTYHMLGEREFSMMKNTALLVNTARGGVLDEKALIKALEEKKIAGAGLDVLEKEPPAPDNPLLFMENVLITPHSGAYSEDAYRRLEIRVFEEAAKILGGITR